MEIIYPRCCGLDVHKRSVAACVRRLEADGRLDQETRTFGTMTGDLLEIADWLAAAGVTHVAMEATGVYWKPIYNLLEDRFTLLLVNARHVKHVPGRKTDVKDCQWLAQLLQAWLLQPSFIPARPQREFRELTRHRSQLVAEEGPGGQPSATGPGRRQHQAGVGGHGYLGRFGPGHASVLDQPARPTPPRNWRTWPAGSCAARFPNCARSLEGKVTEHHRFLLGQLLAHVEHLEGQIEALSRRIEELSGPFAELFKAGPMGREVLQMAKKIPVIDDG